MQLGRADLVMLLLDHGADPTKTDHRGRVPYFLCAKKEARNAFRRFRGLKPDM
jgi:phosphopentomutase